jgi:hypothetical protein
MTMIKEYNLIMEWDNGADVMRQLVTFPKSREGLEAAYEAAMSCEADWWEIVCGEESVDSLGDAMQRHFASA